jgi:catechol 2,3-dioxygenase-like lactoylglutathione lyase family enzyme
MCDDAPMELRVVRHTDRFDAACAFWGDLLGWPTTRSWPADEGQGRGRIFGYGDTARVELIEVPVAVPVTGVYLGAQVDDVAGIVAGLMAAGHTLVRPLADQPWGHRNATVRDPSGIELTVFQVMADHD